MRWLDDAALGRLRDIAADEPSAATDRYEIVEELGRGGMGTVYLARDRALDREVALKALSGAADAGLVERMRREARILARLEHPGIVPVHDVGTLPDGRAFYAMKRVRGERLDAFASGAASLPTLLRAFVRICEAVAFAHAHGVVHRDLKPQNVMVGSFGEVLVLDWGIARFRVVDRSSSSNTSDPSAASDPSTDSVSSDLADSPDSGDSIDAVRLTRTAHGTVLGTPGFMAPEQARGDVEAVDARADVYALGAILRFLLERAAAAGTRAPRPLLAIVAKATADEPGDRYAGAAELSADVSRWLDGLAVAAYRENLAERARRFYARHQMPILLVLAYLLMRVLLLVFAR